jgi:hypothetical protein
MQRPKCCSHYKSTPMAKVCYLVGKGDSIHPSQHTSEIAVLTNRHRSIPASAKLQPHKLQKYACSSLQDDTAAARCVTFHPQTPRRPTGGTTEAAAAAAHGRLCNQRVQGAPRPSDHRNVLAAAAASVHLHTKTLLMSQSVMPHRNRS